MSGFALGNKKTSVVLQVWDELPRKVVVPDQKIEVHAPSSGWTHGDFIFDEITDDELPDGIVVGAHVLNSEVVLTKGSFRREWTLDNIALAEVEASCSTAVLAAAEVRRNALSDPNPAKRDTYMLKAQVAERSVTNTAEVAKFAGEAAARGMTAEDLRDLVAVKAQQWEAAAFAIATAEAEGLAAITAAKTGAAKIAARDTAILAIEAVGAT